MLHGPRALATLWGATALVLAITVSHAATEPSPRFVRTAAIGATPSARVTPGTSGLTATTWRQADAATQARAAAWMRDASSGWTPNRGQIAGSDGRAATNVLFTADVPEAQVIVTTTGLSHYFLSRAADEDAAGPRGNARAERHERPEPVEWERVDLTLAGATIRPELAQPEDQLVGQGGANYYRPLRPDGVLDVPSYGKVTFPAVYPGIDWVVRSEPGEGVHHEFIVQPGADVTRIRLEYAGAAALELSADQRSLRVRTTLGEVREGALACWQGDASHPVGARFHVEGHTVSVQVDAYDRSRPLVIDPPMVWATYYGGSNYDGPRSIYCDNVDDAIYIVGYTASSNLPVQNAGGAAFYQGTSNGGTEGFIWKFTQAGVRQWATYYGGTGNDSHADCAVDASGNLYVCGFTGSTDLPTQTLAGAYNQPANGGSEDGYVLKFDASGVRQWATYYGGAGDDYANGITTDATGKVYVCGTTTSPDLALANPGGGAYFQGALASSQDAFIARFGANGALEWATYYGGASGNEDAYGITTALGRLYVTGNTDSPSFPTQDPGGGAYFQGVLAGAADGFIARFTLAGVRNWSTYFGGTAYDYADEPVVDASGHLFVCGYTQSTDLPTFNPGGGAYYQNANAGSFDFFLAEFSSIDAPMWSTYFGGSSDEFLMGGQGKPLTLDALGRVYLTGMTTSADMPLLNPGGGSFFQNVMGGGDDAIIAQFANNGTMLWSTFFGTGVTDFGTSVGIGSTGCLFVTGESWNGGSLGTVDPGLGAWYQTTNAGSDDGFIAKFCSPNSACCVDFNCVAVSSASQCTALGGTAFYPNQPCSTVTCTILCSICGKKFADLNHNGVQDPGEPGVPNWTIELDYPGGASYSSTITDANGDYCFHNLPCGAWSVREVQQPGWVQTYPSPPAQALTLGTGTTQNAVNFGNYACATTTPCVGIPVGLAAWWPFEDAPGSTIAADVTHADPLRNTAHLAGGATSGGGGSGGSGGGTTGPGSLCLASPADFAHVPVADQVGLAFGGGSFAIAAWIDPVSSTTGPRLIAEKRVRFAGSAYATRGWALYLDAQQSFLEVGTGGAPQVVPGPTVPAGSWSHLAVSIDRKTGQGRWYLDGGAVAALDFTPLAGSVTSESEVEIGQVSPAFGPAPGFQGCIGDLALFATPLSAAMVSRTFGGGLIGWCPETIAMPLVTTICKSQTAATVCFTICNHQPTAQSYHWSVAGLPAGTGCTVAGPAQFDPAAGSVLVPAGGCSPPICVSVPRPPGLTAQNATACFGLTLVNDVTGVCRTRTAMLRADNTCWCVTPQQNGIVSVPARLASGAVIGIGIGHPCDPVALLSYRVRAEWLDPDQADPLAVSLNGLAPGTPVSGQVSAGPGADQMLGVTVSYPNGYDPAARYEIVLEGDTDGDGQFERLCGTIVEPAYDSTGTVGVPVTPAAFRSVRLLASPNPFLGGSTIGFTLAHPEPVDLGIYDLSGRLVRSLLHGRLPAGTHRYEWNGRDDGGRRAPAGVYFVRMDGSGGHLETKLVKMR